MSAAGAGGRGRSQQFPEVLLLGSFLQGGWGGGELLVRLLACPWGHREFSGQKLQCSEMRLFGDSFWDITSRTGSILPSTRRLYVQVAGPKLHIAGLHVGLWSPI